MNSMIELFNVMQSNWGFYLQRSLSYDEEKFLSRWVECVKEVQEFKDYDEAFQVLLRDYSLFLNLSRC